MTTTIPLPRCDMTHRPPRVLEALFCTLRVGDGPIPLPVLEQTLAALPATLDSLGDSIALDMESYVRTLVFRSARAEVFLMAWLPGQRSPIHDHAGSACAVRVVSGSAVERLYALNADGTVFPDGTERRLGPGDVTGSFDSDIHAMGNAASAPASSGDILVTIHVYSPPLAPTAKYLERR